MTSLNINSQTGLLNPVIFKPSPYHDERPKGIEIDMIVIHGISLPPGEFGSDAVDAFFCGQLDFSLHEYYASIAKLQVSAHLFIKRDGEIIQFVPFHKRAWHAGISSFNGKTGCNDFSIGIELEGTDHIAYEKIQYMHLGKIIRLLMTKYPNITHDRILGHVDIAPDRKTDPGPAFDWNYLKGIVA